MSVWRTNGKGGIERGLPIEWRKGVDLLHAVMADDMNAICGFVHLCRLRRTGGELCPNCRRWVEEIELLVDIAEAVFRDTGAR